jgi:hypothetical protein
MSARDERVLSWQRNELLFATLATIGRFCRRYWFIVTPITAGFVWGLIGFLLCAIACGLLFRKQVQTESARLQARYEAAGGREHYEGQQQLAALWPDVARACGLDQKAKPSPLGIKGAASRQLHSVEHGLAADAFGSEDSVVPEVDTIATTSLGYRLDIVMLDGQTVDHYRKAAPALANCFGVEDIRIVQKRPKVVSVTPVETDPLANGRSLTPDTLRGCPGSRRT